MRCTVKPQTHWSKPPLHSMHTLRPRCEQRTQHCTSDMAHHCTCKPHSRCQCTALRLDPENSLNVGDDRDFLSQKRRREPPPTTSDIRVSAVKWPQAARGCERDSDAMDLDPDAPAHGRPEVRVGSHSRAAPRGFKGGRPARLGAEAEPGGSKGGRRRGKGPPAPRSRSGKGRQHAAAGPGA